MDSTIFKVTRGLIDKQDDKYLLLSCTENSNSSIQLPWVNINYKTIG